MSLSIILRPVIREDFEALISLRQDLEVLDNLMSYPAPEPASAEQCKAWLKLKLSNAALALLAIEDEQGSCAGYVQISQHHCKGGYAWFGIALTPSAQGRGQGRSAMKALIEYSAKTLGLRKLLCEVRNDNDRALRLYSNFGFTQVGTLSRHYRSLSGTWHDVAILELFLP